MILAIGKTELGGRGQGSWSEVVRKATLGGDICTAIRMRWAWEPVELLGPIFEQRKL